MKDSVQINTITMALLDSLKTADEIVSPDEYRAAVAKLLESGNPDALSDKEWQFIVSRGNCVGIAIRTAYYKTVHKMGYDPDNFWHALIKLSLAQNLWAPALELTIENERVKGMINKTSDQKWTVFGIIGGNWKDIYREAEKYSKSLNRLGGK